MRTEDDEERLLREWYAAWLSLMMERDKNNGFQGAKDIMIRMDE